jgi:TolA-binding protein
MKVRKGCIGLVAAAALCAGSISCAYYNTLYNARKIYREAEKSSATSGSSREQREKYQKVIEKCAKVITEYPKSRWVDDAVFLMGMALLRQQEYDKSIRKFEEILTNFPESDYAPQARHQLAVARYRRQDYEAALADVERFLADYPRHELRFETLFLGGDVKGALGEDEAALAYYERVAEAGGKAELIDEARVRSAELFYARGDWERAAANYERVMRKGLPWERRYRISLRLGECYARIGKCDRSLALTTDLLEKATTALEAPPVMLARAAGFECMDSLGAALAAYDEVIVRYPKSLFSAEAYYRKGVLYDERLDSLRAAEAAFSKVGGEYANSAFAPEALEKSTSIRRLMELRRAALAGETTEQAAEKIFMTAEIQFMKLGDAKTALAGYVAVLDSFPAAAIAPRAAYAIAWIEQHRLERSDSAAARYRALVERYPRSPQVRGALHELRALGELELVERLRAYADSALADTAAANAELRAAAAAASVRDTLRLSPPPDTARTVQPPDTARTAPLDTARIAPGGNP